MSTDQSYNQANDFRLQRNRLVNLIKSGNDLIEKLETRMEEIETEREQDQED